MMKKHGVSIVLLLAIIASYAVFGGYQGVMEYRALQGFDRQLQGLLQELPQLSQAEGVERLSALLEGAPEYPAIWERSGDLYARLQWWDRAAQSYSRAYHKTHKTELGITYLNALSMQGQGALSEEGSQLLAELLQKEPDNPNLLNIQALHAFSNQQYTLAKTLWEKLLIQIDVESTLRPLIEEALSRITIKKENSDAILQEKR